MATQCIKISLEDDPLKVLKGCSSIMSCLDDDFTENIYSYHAIKLIADVLTDAVSRLEDVEEDDLSSNEGIETS